MEFSAFNHLIFATPNSNDNLQLSSALALGGQNALRLTGTSGGLPFEVPTFFNVATLELDLGSNDGGGADDRIVLNGGVAPVGITTVAINTVRAMMR